MKKRLFTLLLTCICLTAIASEPPKYLLIWAKNGIIVTYDLTSRPQITFTETDLVISKDGITTNFPMDNILRFSYKNTMLGDVNGDGKIDNTDVTSTVNHILGNTPEVFSSEAADINTDKKINIADVTCMINAIHNKDDIDFPTTTKTAGEAFYVYRNDNQINAFFRTEIDSIVFSHYDSDSIYYESIVSQAVCTPDSIYQIPLTLVDSVGFMTPQTVYQPGVRVLDGKIRNYIISHHDLCLMFQSSISKDLLPHVGDKLVTTEADNVITNAFVGQVSEVNITADGIEVICTPVDLTDVFETYYGIIKKTNEPISAKTRNVSDGFYGTYGTRTLSPGKLTLDLLNTHNTQINYSPDDELSFSLNNARAAISLTPTIDYNAYVIVNKTYGVNVSVTAVGNYTVEEILALSGSIQFGGDVPLFEKAIPIPEALLDLYFEFGIFNKMTGKFCVDQTWTQKYRHTFHWEWSSKGHQTLKNINDFKPMSSTHNGKIAINGSWGAGAYGKVGIAFIATSSLDIAEIGLKAEGGLMTEGTYVPYKKDEEYAKRSTDLYNQIKDREVTSYFYYGLSGEAKLFKWSISHEVPNFFNIPLNKRWPFATVRDVPLFSNTKLIKDGSGTYYASVNVDGTVHKTDVGFALINKNNEEDATYSYSIYDYQGPKVETYASFFDKPSTNSYTLYPLVKYMDMELIAEPSAEIGLCPDDNHPHMIDLGLPSGTKWACCNIDASAPYEFGGLYAWGETEEKSYYSASNYKFAQASSNGWIEIDGTLYNFIYIGENICGTNYDVANVKWGNPWRMPSATEMEELVSQCKWQEDNQNGVYAYKVTGPNGASIVLPGFWLNYWTGNLNHEASYWWNNFEPIPYVLWSDPSPHVHSPIGTSSELGYFSAPYQSCSVRPVCDSRMSATRKMMDTDNNITMPIVKDPGNNIIIVAKEKTEMTMHGKRTIMKFMRK